MQYYRCKCGNMNVHTSMGVSACTRCGKCGSNAALGPDSHSDPAPHEFETKYDQNTGVPYERCRPCGQRKSDLEKRNEAQTPWTPPDPSPTNDGTQKEGK